MWMWPILVQMSIIQRTDRHGFVSSIKYYQHILMCCRMADVWWWCDDCTCHTHAFTRNQSVTKVDLYTHATSFTCCHFFILVFVRISWKILFSSVANDFADCVASDSYVGICNDWHREIPCDHVAIRMAPPQYCHHLPTHTHLEFDLRWPFIVQHHYLTECTCVLL